MVRAGVASAMDERVWHTLVWTVFGAAYVGAIVFVAEGLRRESRPRRSSSWPPGAASRSTSARPSARSGSCVDLARLLAPPGLLRGRCRSPPSTLTAPVPEPLDDGHPLRSRVVRGTREPSGSCSTTCRSTCPPGGVVAIVGENGAGKTTLGEAGVQALRADVRTNRGRRRRPRPSFPPTSGATRLAGAFQDFFRFEFRAHDSVGLGDLPTGSTTRRGGRDRGRAGRCRRRDRAARRSGSTPSSDRRGTKGGGLVWPVAEARARAWFHA